MAEVQITLKLSASEFQTLRRELRDHSQALRDARYEEGGKRSPMFADYQAREAQVAALLEKLG